MTYLLNFYGPQNFRVNSPFPPPSAAGSRWSNSCSVTVTGKSLREKGFWESRSNCSHLEASCTVEVVVGRREDRRVARVTGSRRHTTCLGRESCTLLMPSTQWEAGVERWVLGLL